MRSIIVFLSFISFVAISSAQPQYNVVVPPQGKGEIVDIAFTSADRGVVILDRSIDTVNIYLTSDAGTTWKPVGSTGKWGAQHVVFVDSLRGFICETASDFESQVTTDGGETWTSIGYSFASISTPSSSCFYAVSNPSLTLYRSRDLGQSWTYLPLPSRDTEMFYSSGNQVSFRDPLHGFVTGMEGGSCGHTITRTFYTSDGGITWSQPYGKRAYESNPTVRPAYVGNEIWLVTGLQLFDETTQARNGSIPHDRAIQVGSDRAWSVLYGVTSWPAPRSDVLYEISEGGKKRNQLLKLSNLQLLNSFGENVGVALIGNTREQDSSSRIVVTSTGWRGSASVLVADEPLALRLEQSNIYLLSAISSSDHLELYDFTGQQLPLASGDGRIDLTTFPPGVYYLRAGAQMLKLLRTPN